jgi:hypothetical protein
MTSRSFEELAAEFHFEPGDPAFRRDGKGRAGPQSKKKLCFVVTDLRFLAELMLELSLRDDCFKVKFYDKSTDGMYLGRCWLNTDEAAARACQHYKPHPKLMVSIQDDDFFDPYRGLDHLRPPVGPR